ncbi:probable lactoylglutathione lyase, chloroplastic isoform X2 [Jatropha curcas]|uniref:probable lactoylglutathione lyase, chloroplastic isoform X2 n=1 Tax=Jatropha curcas TaxID=180498 RepID=UPI0005FACB50|nr:probable lactoylglutathione lyase, chloroplastic isoform X2 [Jatropha curcas]
MLALLPLPSSSSSSSFSPLCLSTQKNISPFNSNSLKLSSLQNGSSSNWSDGNPSRRLALFQLGAAIPESHLLGVRTSKLLRGDGNVMESSASPKMTQQYWVCKPSEMNRFYTECLGMKLLRKRDIPEERYTNAFLGYGPEDSNFTVELTYNYGVDKYNIGNGFGHFGIAVEDVAKTVNLVKAKGGRVTQEPGIVKGGSTITAFVEDPDGYKFELLQRGPTPEPMCQVMLRVGDLDRSINFYKKAFGMQLLRKRDNPESKYTVGFMGYGPEDKNAVLELTYNYGITEYDKGNGYAQIAIGTNDVYKSAEAIKLCGGNVILEPGPLPGINTKITACLDPDGWKSVFVDNVDFLRELE